MAMKTTSETKGWLRFYLSEDELARVKRIATLKGMDYRAMLRMWITERERQEEAA